MIKISTVTTLKASLEDTLYFVNYHLKLGIDHMFLFFHDPQDPAIEKLSTQNKLTIIPMGEKYYHQTPYDPDENNFILIQRYNATKAYNDSREYYDWIIHIDADELIHSKNLKKELADLPHSVDIALMLSYEAVANKTKQSDLFSGTKYFKVNLRKQVLQTSILSENYIILNKKEIEVRASIMEKKMIITRLLGIDFSTRGFFQGHKLGKSAMRTQKNLTVGPHLPTAKEMLKLVVLKNVKLLHFECTNYKVWYKKMETRTKHKFDTHSSKRMSVLKYFMKYVQENNQNSLHLLYHRLYSLNSYQIFMLKLMGLIQRINFK